MSDLLDSGVVLEAPAEEKEVESTTDAEPSMVFLQDWFELTAMDRLNVEKQDRIKYIYDFVKSQTGNTDPFNVFKYLREISYKLGAPRLGQSKLQHVYQWVKLQNQREVINIKEQELING